MTKVCHMTSAHGEEDVRIFHKECVSLAKAGYEVYLVERGATYDKDGVHIIGVGEIPASRIKRMTRGAKAVYKQACKLDADIYHFHDPELLPYGLKLKKSGKKVIFDSHEDVPAQIMDKGWIPNSVRKLVASLYRTYESYVVERIDAVVAATPTIRQGFVDRTPIAVDVNNYPKLDDIVFHDTPFAEREAIVCYAGGISENRGESVMLAAMEGIEGELVLAGPWEGHKRERERERERDDGRRVRYLGILDRCGVNTLYGQAVVGLCVLKPTANYINSLPIKMFEYMAAGLPFVCSDFPRWKKIADETGAGVCVSVDDINAVHKAIQELLSDRSKAQQMGRRGRMAIEQRYCWSMEEDKLLSLYYDISA